MDHGSGSVPIFFFTAYVAGVGLSELKPESDHKCDFQKVKDFFFKT